MTGTFDVDEGQDGGAVRRLLQLAAWLHHGAPATFTKAKVLELDAWHGISEDAYEQAWTTARQQLAPYGVEVEETAPNSGTYRVSQPVAFSTEDRQVMMLALAVADVGPLPTFGVGLDRSDAAFTIAIADELAILLDAIADRTPVEITHRGDRRVVDPYGVGMRSGRWYLAGRDHRRDRLRIFGLGRGRPGAEPPRAAGPTGSFIIPAGFDMTAELASPPGPVTPGAGVTARVLVDPDAIEAARLALAAEPGELEGGGMSFVVDAPDLDSLVRRVLALRTRARIVEPSTAIEHLRQHLLAIGRPASRAEAMATSTAPRPDNDAAAPRGRTGRLLPRHRLAIITTAMMMSEAADGPVPIADVARATNVSEDQARRALRQYEFAEYSLLQSGVGLVEIGVIRNGLEVDDERETVTAQDPWWLDTWRPTPAEAVRLWVAASVALSAPADEQSASFDRSLDRARRKLARLLRSTPAVVEPPIPKRVTELRKAAREGRSIWFAYLAGHSTLPQDLIELDVDRVHRNVDRWVVHGHVRRHCTGRPTDLEHGVPDPSDHEPVEDEMRRVVEIDLDRVIRWRVGDRAADPLGEDSPAATPAGEPVRIKLDIAKESRWMLDPFELRRSVRKTPGRRVVEVVLPGLADVRTLVLQLGGTATLLAPPELLDLQTRLAADILERYR